MSSVAFETVHTVLADSPVAREAAILFCTLPVQDLNDIELVVVGFDFSLHQIDRVADLVHRVVDDLIDVFVWHMRVDLSPRFVFY